MCVAPTVSKDSLTTSVADLWGDSIHGVLMFVLVPCRAYQAPKSMLVSSVSDARGNFTGQTILGVDTNG